MKKAFVILLLLLTKSISLFAQTNYDIKVLGALNNKIEFDTSLNWYAIEIKNEEKSLYSKQRFLKLNVEKDIKIEYLKNQYFVKNKDNKDSLVIKYYYNYKLASKYKKCSIVLIGSKKILFTNWGNASLKYNSKLNHNFKIEDLYWLESYGRWEFDFSLPTVQLHVSGFSYKCFKNDSSDYHLNVLYYTNSNEFVQSLDNEINSLKGYKNIISDLHIEYLGNIDNDGIDDFILTDWYNNRYYLFLSCKHDLKEKKIMHLEKGYWNDCYEFFKDF